MVSLSVFVAACGGQAQITLSWNDNSSNEDGFKIERSIDAAAYAQIATVGANIETYQDTLVVDNQTYTYRVRAYNAYGDSGYSNVVSGSSGTTSTTESDTIAISFSGLDGGIYEPGQSDAFQVIVDGAQSPVESVQLYVNGIIISTELQEPYDFVFNPTLEGPHLLKAMVTTDLGVYEKSEEVTVEASVNAVPTLSELPDISVPEGGTSTPIEFTIGDAETNSDSLVVEATSSNTELLPNTSIVLGGSGSLRTIAITAPENLSGDITVTVSVNDGVDSVSQSLVVSIVAVSAPTISQIPDVEVFEDDSIEPLAFVVEDSETPVEELVITASSSNGILLPQGSLVISGNGSNRTISVAPVDQVIGESVVTIVVNDGTTTASESFRVAVYSAEPEILKEPEDLLELNGGITAFSVEVRGKPDLSFQWFFNDSPIEGANQASHVLEGVSNLDAGDYKVQVSNAYGATQSRSATLTIQSAITDSQRRVVSTIDESGQLILSVEEGGDNLKYQWYTGTSGDKSNPIEGATDSSFMPQEPTEGASYWVEVTVDSGSASNVDVAQSDTFVVEETSPELDRYFFGDFTGGTSGKFGLYVRSDNTAVFLGHIEHRKSIIASVDLDIKADGSFHHKSREFGWINGIIGETSVSGGVAKRDLTFSGDLSVLNGTTGAIAGFYDGVITNTADGQTFVLAGPNGEAYVISGSGSNYTGYEGTLSEDGLITVSAPEEEFLSLRIDTGSQTLTGTATVDSEERVVLGQNENMDTESELYNASIRAQVKGGSSVMIAGFVVLGPEEKQVLIRGIGPTLRSQGVGSALANPRLTLYQQGIAEPIGFNDDWRDSENASQIEEGAAHAGAFNLPFGSKDSALLVSLPQGVYTAHVESVNGQEGTALVEIYDVDSAFGINSDSRLVNMSLRGEIGSGDNVVISGFVVSGTSSKRMLVRAVGPELSQFGISNVLEDPLLTIYKFENGEMLPIVNNDDWGEDPINASESGSRAGAFPLEVESKSSAKVVWLEPGLYTAVASGTEGQTGIALVEIYEVD